MRHQDNLHYTLLFVKILTVLIRVNVLLLSNTSYNSKPTNTTSHNTNVYVTSASGHNEICPIPPLVIFAFLIFISISIANSAYIYLKQRSKPKKLKRTASESEGTFQDEDAPTCIYTLNPVKAGVFVASLIRNRHNNWHMLV